MEDQLSEERLAESLSWLRVVLAEDVGGEVVGVNAVVPPLRQVFVRALEPAGEGVRSAAEARECQAHRRDGYCTKGRRVWCIFGQGIERYFYVTEAVEAVRAYFGSVLAAQLVRPFVFLCFDSYLVTVLACFSMIIRGTRLT